ncbi:MAG: M20 family metallopeptidase [Alistipes senegalensis]|nr:M20 family metallopeptidase [Oxalobacter formigenes]MCM1280316.1 M20 family metallopeptidase [Alistipes senegalensis]
MSRPIDFPPAFLEEIKAIRRDIHAHPETAYEETRTADLIAGKLQESGIAVIRGIGGTGVIGKIKNGKSRRAIGLRADMDALPINETNRFAHASRHPGKMHACGHDGHTAMLLGAAIHLANTRRFDGTVYTIFQPAEEGHGGAKRMIQEGLFNTCPVDAIFGLHNWPDYAAGTFAVRTGPLMASSNTFTLTIHGKGGHGAQPNQTIDPIMTAVQIAQSWQTIISRNKAPAEAATLSVTRIEAGNTFNVIPNQAVMAGTVRTFTPEVLDLVEQRMREIAGHTAAAFHCRAEFVFHRNYPPLANHPAETAFAIDVMESIAGPSRVVRDAGPTMIAEDFSFMLAQKPGCYAFIGASAGEYREAGHSDAPCRLHSPGFDFNDAILPTGMSYWIRLAETCLAPPAGSQPA